MNSVNSESSMCYVPVISLDLNIQTMSHNTWSSHIMLNYISNYSKLSKMMLYYSNISNAVNAAKQNSCGGMLLP